MLCGEQALQSEGLLDTQAGELVAGLGNFEGTGSVSGAGHGVAEQARVDIDAVDDLALHEGGTPEARVFFVPSALGIAQHVIAREGSRDLPRKQLLVAGLGRLQSQRDALAGAELGLDVGEGALQIR